jgi:mRNA interferase MazF/mRNA interferase ChpB
MHPSAGKEQRGRHAGLILSGWQFNRATGFAFIAPITTVGNASRGSNFAVTLSGAGTATTGVVQVDQVKSMDWRGRNPEKSKDTVPNELLLEVLERFAPIFGLGVLEPDDEDPPTQ